MSHTKKYILTSITLGTIAAISAGLIALTYLATHKKIDENNTLEFEKGITAIFKDYQYDSVSEVEGVNFGESKTAKACYKVQNGESLVGYVLKSEGSNSYGKITMLSGFKAETFDFISLHLISNEQSYASTLQKKYINPIKEGEKDIYSTEQTSCGATRGAELVQSMVLDAQYLVNLNFGSK